MMTSPKATQHAGMRVGLRPLKSCTSCCFSQAAQVGTNEETTFFLCLNVFNNMLQHLDQSPCAATREDGGGQSLLKSPSCFSWKPTKSR